MAQPRSVQRILDRLPGVSSRLVRFLNQRFTGFLNGSKPLLLLDKGQYWVFHHLLDAKARDHFTWCAAAGGVSA
jgi:hypothetical protein